MPLMQSLKHSCDAMVAPRILRAVHHDHVLRARQRRQRVRIHVDHLCVAAVMRRSNHRHCQAEAQQSDLK